MFLKRNTLKPKQEQASFGRPHLKLKDFWAHIIHIYVCIYVKRVKKMEQTATTAKKGTQHRHTLAHIWIEYVFEENRNDFFHLINPFRIIFNLFTFAVGVMFLKCFKRF